MYIKIWPSYDGTMISALLSLFIVFSHADFKISQNLTDLQRKLVLKTLGLGTMSKNMSTPHSLGSNRGVEIGIATEIISIDRIRGLVDNSQAADTLYYPKILIGKGIYDYTDIFFHFIPYTATLGVSEFGGMIRLNVVRSEKSPFVVSLIGHANSANFNNQLTSRNVGADLSLGMDWKMFSIFTGIGYATSSGRFVGGPQGITDSGFTETETANSMHFAVGTLVRYGIFNASLSLDHYVEPVYTIKVGVLF